MQPHMLGNHKSPSENEEFHVMSVNKNVLKEIHKNHKEQTDIKLKAEEMGPMQVFFLPKWVL